VYYKGRKIGRKRVDFIVEDVMVEIKAKAALEEVDFVQTLLISRHQATRLHSCSTSEPNSWR
jgi:hypothetical protein